MPTAEGPSPPLPADALDAADASAALAAALEPAPVAIVWLSEQPYEVRWANARARQVWGLALQQSLRLQARMAPAHWPALQAMLQTCQREGHAQATLMFGSLLPPPGFAHAQARRWPTPQSDGMLLFVDASDGRAQRALDDRFFHILAHDLRNPIGSAKMSVDGIARSKQAPEPITQKARRASLALSRADALIGRCLDVRAVQAGGQLPLQKTTSALSILAQAAAAKANTLSPGRVQCVIDAPGDGQWDESYMGRAIDDVLHVAGKYGGSHKGVQLHVAQSALQVRVAGVQIPEPERALLEGATPWQPRDDGQKSSVGMGLALVRLVAEGHGGALRVLVEPDASVFCLQFGKNDEMHKSPLVE